MLARCRRSCGTSTSASRMCLTSRHTAFRRATTRSQARRSKRPYADVCWRMLTYAHVCSRMLTYAHVCLGYSAVPHSVVQLFAHRIGAARGQARKRMLTYAGVVLRMLRMLTYADVCRRGARRGQARAAVPVADLDLRYGGTGHRAR
jgi:hypothetical protein